MKNEVKFLTRKEFATRIDCVPSYVTKLGNQGRLVLSPDGKLVDVEASMALIDSSRVRPLAQKPNRMQRVIWALIAFLARIPRMGGKRG